jgi:copper chaperone CopZ
MEYTPESGPAGTPPEPKPTRMLAAASCWWIALFVLLVAVTLESLSTAPGTLRLVVVLLAAGVLAVGFVLFYGRRPAPGVFVGLRRFNAVMLWMVAVGVAAYALAPREGPKSPAMTPKEMMSFKPGVDEAQLAGASKRTLGIGGMVCQSCVETVTAALLGVPGVLSADVELESGRAVVSSAADAAPADTTLITAVEAAGYKAWPLAGGEVDSTGRARGNHE